MKKNAKELYQILVNARIGESINTKYKGKNYKYTITDALTQQGYTKDVDFEVIFNYTECQNYIKKLKDIKPYKEPQHNIKVGDIFYHSWGHEQTNIDFYQVVKTTKKTVTLKRIRENSDNYDSNTMTGSVKALKDNFVNDESIRKTPYLYNNEWWINFDYGVGKQWEGEEVGYSCYA